MLIGVPAAAAIPLARENCIMNVRTGSVGGFGLRQNGTFCRQKARVKSGVLRIVRVAMKCTDPYQTTNGESTIRASTDAKG